MDLRIQREDYAVLVRLLRAWRDWTRVMLQSASGLDEDTLYNYEKGNTKPGRAKLEKIAQAVQVPLFVIDYFLLPAIVAVRTWSSAGEAATAICQRLAIRLQGIARRSVEIPCEPGPAADERKRTSWSPAGLEEARFLWKRLEDLDDEDRRHLVERCDEYHHPGLAVLLCHQSAEAASDTADQARSLAQLARRVAELAPGDEPSKMSLMGYGLLFDSNTVRVSGRLKEARGQFTEGLAGWEAGDRCPGLIAEWRVLDLEASLLRDEKSFDAALARLEKALAMAPEEAGRILSKKSAVLEHMGEGEQAIEVLREADRHADRHRQPRLFFGIRFNLATSLCLLDRFEEAAGMLPEIQALVAGLRLELHGLRVRWLKGRVLAGLRRLEEAAAALEEVRQYFTKHRAVWHCSQVTLELATVRLRLGETAEVKWLARQLVWVFEAQGIHQEALAALALFREAAEHELATAEFAEKIVRYLRKAQSDPELRFTE